MPTEAPSSRSQVRRHPDRASYDRVLIEEILDEALICHLSYVGEDGGPRLIPTIHARDDDILYLHGSAASRTITRAAEGVEICVAATIVDAIVFARSAFHHSMNYRSAVVFGTARLVTDPDELQRAARVLSDHVADGRGAEVRMPRDDELKQTTIVALPIHEASAKARTGPPVDDPADADLPVWTGILPISLVGGEPEDAPDVIEGLTAPDYIRSYRR